MTKKLNQLLSFSSELDSYMNVALFLERWLSLTQD